MKRKAEYIEGRKARENFRDCLLDTASLLGSGDEAFQEVRILPEHSRHNGRAHLEPLDQSNSANRSNAIYLGKPYCNATNLRDGVIKREAPSCVQNLQQRLDE